VGDRLALLVLDGYPAEGRAALRSVGASEAGPLYARILQELAPEARVAVGTPADPDWELPPGTGPESFDGMLWTGSSLTIHREGDARVARQLALVRAAFRAGVPSFGSCWGAQLAAVAAGGRCAEHPRGREFGVARQIQLSEAGREHPLFRGKPASFDAFTSHQDQVVALPPGARLLASNDWSRVQALCVEQGAGSFWAVQYHPEYDLAEVAALCRLRAAELVAQGQFPDPAAAEAWASGAEALHADPARRDLAEALRVGAELLDPLRRRREVSNWLSALVQPTAASRR
jgi:GMP synthase (glutamine-hydrolysing)